MSTLAAAILGRHVLTAVGKRHGLTGQETRLLAAVSVVSEGGMIPTYKGLMRALGITTAINIWLPLQTLVARGYVAPVRVKRQLGRTVQMSILLEPAGAVLIAEIERAMREAIEDTKRIVGAKPGRKILRKTPKANRRTNG